MSDVVDQPSEEPAVSSDGSAKVSRSFFQADLVSRPAALCLGLTMVLALAARLLVSICLHPLRIGWDPALHLMCAALICQGKLPYVDMFDVNPPLIWYINTLPASLAAFFNAPLPLSFNLFLLFLIALAGLLSAYVIVEKLPRRDLFVNFGVLFGLLFFNFFLTVDFGQREEIFVLLFTPFAFFRMARWQGEKLNLSLAIIFGLVGAVGIFMKHYFVLNFVFFELFCCFYYRLKAFRRAQFLTLLKPLLAPEILTIGCLGLAYLAHFFFLPAAVRHNYFDFLVPAFARGYYFWDTSVTNCIATPYKRDIFLIFTACGALALGLVRFYPVFGWLVSFGLASVVVYLMQFKGWAYQDIPVTAAAYMIAWGLVGALVSLLVTRLSPSTFGQGRQEKGCSAKSFSSPATIAAYGLALLLAGSCLFTARDEITLTAGFPSFDMALLGYRGTTPMMDIEGPFTESILKNSKTDDPIVFISNAVAPGFPITMQLRRRAGSRHLHVCILSVLQYIRSGSVRDVETKRLLDYDPLVVKELGEDILKNKPPLVYLQEAPIKNDYFLPYDFVKRYLYRYKEVEPIINFSVYKLENPDAPAPVLPPLSRNEVK
ncbi:MAG: hypothetical protein KGS72_15655 [Cyanobacteria bacterium REEB67]|nr:hypothetical protein [Cyanobacteria bacterium REEB67]